VCSKSKIGEPIITPVSQDDYAVINEKQCFLFEVNKPERKKLQPEEKGGKKKNVVITWSDCPIGLGNHLLM